MAETDFVELEHGFGAPAVPQTIQEALEEVGIPCLVKTDSGIAAAPLAMATPTWSVLVRQEDLERARQALVDAQEEGFDDSEFEDLRSVFRRGPSLETAPGRVIGSVAGVLFVVGLVTLPSSPLGLLLIALGLFAGFVAHRSRK